MKNIRSLFISTLLSKAMIDIAKKQKETEVSPEVETSPELAQSEPIEKEIEKPIDKASLKRQKKIDRRIQAKKDPKYFPIAFTFPHVGWVCLQIKFKDGTKVNIFHYDYHKKLGKNPPKVTEFLKWYYRSTSSSITFKGDGWSHLIVRSDIAGFIIANNKHQKSFSRLNLQYEEMFCPDYWHAKWKLQRKAIIMQNAPKELMVHHFGYNYRN